MKYIQFKTNLNISQLGLGCMRFAVIDNDDSKIDEAHAEKMIMSAYENGVNYFDTTYIYHVNTSEKFVGKVLKNNNIRSKINLATKNPTRFVKEHSDYYKLFDEQFNNLQTDYLGFYLLHSLNAASWHNAKKHDLFKFMDAIKKKVALGKWGFHFTIILKYLKI